MLHLPVLLFHCIEAGLHQTLRHTLYDQNEYTFHSNSGEGRMFKCRRDALHASFCLGTEASRSQG